MFLRLRRFLYRSWFYFRIGYGTYFALLIGIASNIIVIYKLSIVDIKFLDSIFPTLTIFTIAAILVAAPLSVLVGLLHMKRSGAYAADASVSLEANPYIYKVVPGKEREVILPLMILTARGLAKVMDQQKTMTPEERREFDEVLTKANKLLEGHMVGTDKQPERNAKLVRRA